MAEFAGFPKEAITFFRGLARHNDREWFQPRKDIFDTKVKAPMIELVDALNVHLRTFSPLHVVEPTKAIYRIYRDTRFSSDKTPYKTHIGAYFPRKGSGESKHVSAGYYVAISPKGVETGGGMYAPGPPELIAVRSWIAENHQQFRKVLLAPKKLMGELKGESLQRVPKGFAADDPAADLLKMKQWYFFNTLDVALATTPKLLPEVVKRFQVMQPVLDLLNAPLQKAAKAKQFV
jgi:uncharacterized protein (TIGR02453 family)